MTKKEKQDIQLVKTDYDDFKDLSFFLAQQQKAEAMLREVEEFKKSFVMSKMVSIDDWIAERPLYNLSFFNGIEFAYYFREDGTTGAFIRVCPDDFEHFVFAKEYGHEPNYHVKDAVKKFTSKKRKILKDFWHLMRRTRFQFDTDGEYVYVEDYTNKVHTYHAILPSKVKVEEEKSLFIVNDWQEYVNTEKLSSYLNHCYINYMYDTYDPTCEKKLKCFKIHQNDICPNVIYYDKIYAEMRRRFTEPIELIEDLYRKHYILSSLKYANENTESKFYTHPKNKNCVIWEGRPRWVSNNLDKVQITTNKERTKIICDFDDEIDYAEWQWPSDRPRYNEKRHCRLTYAAKNNELIDYEVKIKKNKYQNRNRY